MRKSIIVIIVLLILGLIGFRVMTAVKNSKAKPTAVVQAIPVKTQALEMRQIKDDLVLTGTIVPDKVVSVSSKLAAGRLLSAPFKEGDNVAASQLIATMEAIENNHSVESAQIGLDTANSQYENAKQNLDRNQKLFDGGLLSQQQLDTAKLSYQTALNAKKQAENSLSLAKSQDNYANVVAPVSGVVLKKFFEAGSLASGPIYSIGVISQVKVQVNLDEKLLAFVKTGQHVTFTVDSWPDQTFDGIISNIQPQVDPATRTILAEITVPNGGRKLFPGMFAKVTVTRRASGNVLTAPLEAVLDENGGKFVYVAVNGKAAKRPIQTGLSDENYIEISSGLSAGDRVIIAGQHSVNEGSPVQDVANGAQGGTNQ